jgi:phosphate starvation-inducible protein PhoH and related proteins
MGKSKRHRSGAPIDAESTPSISYAPRNLKQRDYLRSIQNNDITYGIGAAGSGKTWLAVMTAMDLFERGKFERIVVCRPVVTAGNERIGYLPGNIEEKMDPYLRPVFDAFASHWSPKTIHLYRMERKIDIIPFGFMRGITFRNSFIIADEAQNTTLDQMYMLLTRLGEGSKMVITGDPEQSDVRSDTLAETRQRLSGVKSIEWIDFDPGDVVRHPLVEDIIRNWRS